MQLTFILGRIFREKYSGAEFLYDLSGIFDIFLKFAPLSGKISDSCTTEKMDSYGLCP